MKPCARNRKRIAWLALDAQPPERGAALTPLQYPTATSASRDQGHSLLKRRERRAPAEELRAHLDTCAGCRAYFEELSNITAALSAAELENAVRVSPAFHRRLAASLRAQKSRSRWDALAEAFERLALNWRVALPVAGAVAALVMALTVMRPQPSVIPVTPTAPLVTARPHLKSDLPPTLAIYQSVANRSLDQLDELLTEQGTRNPAPAPVYTASVFALLNASE